MSTKALEQYLGLRGELAEMKALRDRYVAAAAKDAAITLNLNLVINGNAVPPIAVAFASRAVASRVRAALPALWQAAITEQETALADLKRAAKAEYDALFV